MTSADRRFVAVAALVAATVIAIGLLMLVDHVRELDCRQAAIAANLRPSEIDDACR